MLTSPSIWSLDYWRATGERALRTAAQAAALKIGSDSLQVNAFLVDWPTVGGFALGGAVLSLLMSLIGNVATRNGPSFTNSEQVPQPPAPVAEPRG